MIPLLIYYLKILLPLIALVLCSQRDLIDGHIAMWTILCYVFLYRTYIDGKRLTQKGVMVKKDVWKLVIPGVRVTYFKDLYFI
jgi:hypothetical protein